jgi:hypothetical protein
MKELDFDARTLDKLIQSASFNLTLFGAVTLVVFGLVVWMLFNLVGVVQARRT